MATKTNWLFPVCCILLLYAAKTKSFLDIEELRSTNYGIDIINEPVKIGQEVSGNVVQLRSKYGQQYQCSFPDQVQQEKQKEEEEKLALETGIVQLLKPFQTQGCLFKTKDWWSYEFCYGKYIRQMHIEDGAIKGEVIYLGHFESEFDWDNSTKKEQRLKSKRWSAKYHSQTYTNGSKCDLTGKGRTAEVRFFCEEGAGDYVSRIDEPETCNYVVSVYTARICSHPYLKPPAPKLPVPITCSPLLNEQQYMEYLLQVEEEENEKKRLVEEKARELLEEQARSDLHQSQNADRVPSQTEGKDEEVDYKDLDNIFAPSVENIMKKTLSSGIKNLAGSAADKSVDVKVAFKVVKDLSDIEKVFKEVLEDDVFADGSTSTTGSQKDAGNDPSESSNQNVDSQQNSETDETLKFESKEEREKKDTEDENKEKLEEPIEDKELKDEFDKEIGHLKTAYKNKRDKFVNMKNKVRDSMKTQFDEIIDETEEMYGEEIDRKLAFKQLAGTLDKLIHKLENTEKEIDNVDKELENFNKKAMKAGDGSSMEKPTGPGQQPVPRKDGGKKGELDVEDKFKVKVSKVKASDTAKEIDMPAGHKEQLEQTVKDGIIKAGLDSPGGKIQVKIITSNYDGSDVEEAESMYLFSPDGTTNIQNMIVAILGGTTDATKEAEYQQKQEDNYSHVWGRNKNKKSKTKDKRQNGY